MLCSFEEKRCLFSPLEPLSFDVNIRQSQNVAGARDTVDEIQRRQR